MAYVRSKTINGKTYRYLVKSVREGTRVRQVFVSYIGNPPPTFGETVQPLGVANAPSRSSPRPDFTPLTGPEIRDRYVSLIKQLGCQAVVFSLRSTRKHGDVLAHRDLTTGVYQITRVRLNRDASVQALSHEVGHVLDYLLQSEQAESGSLDAALASLRVHLRKLADYTCAHHATSSPEMVRNLKRYPASKARDRFIKRLERYYREYVYEDHELFARLVSVSFTEPEKAKAITPAAYSWLQEKLSQHDRIRVALTEVGLWPEPAVEPRVGERSSSASK